MDPKARPQSLRDEAVSPVIGVILMVAITVVIASIVFILSSQFSKTEHDDPQVTWIFDDQGSRPGGILTVSGIINGPLSVSEILIGGTVTTAGDCAFNGATIGAGGTLGVAGTLQAGDQLSCDSPGTITVTESTRQILLHSNTFH